ncbi:NAD(P)-binding protein [Biscogniauxia mediterranea]|nr:NAD(P)-binding protein [Biscogniauxia mediterranea]
MPHLPLKPRPNFIEVDVESQDEKVFLIASGSSGISFELAKMLYAKHRWVYIAGRSEEKPRQGIKDIQTAIPTRGTKELKLGILWNNAGISKPLLAPLLQAAATENIKSPGSIREVWTASQMTGNLFIASEYARKAGSTHNIVSVAHNPGAAPTNLFCHTPLLRYLASPLLHKAQLAALTSLFAGFSRGTTMQNTGCYVLPWGRLSDNLIEDLRNAMRLSEEGGTSRASEFWQFCEEETRDYSRSDFYLDIVTIAKFKSEFSH